LASSTSTRTQVQLQVHVYFLQRYRHSRCAVVHWLLSLFIAHLVVSGVRVSVSFQIIPRVVGRLGSEVQFSKFCVKKVYPSRHVFTVPSAVPCTRKVIFVPPVLSCFRDTQAHNGAVVPLCAVACFIRTPFRNSQLQVAHYQMSLIADKLIINTKLLFVQVYRRLI